jgi:hypothetical protein
MGQAQSRKHEIFWTGGTDFLQFLLKRAQSRSNSASAHAHATSAWDRHNNDVAPLQIFFDRPGIDLLVPTQTRNPPLQIPTAQRTPSPASAWDRITIEVHFKYFFETGRVWLLHFLLKREASPLKIPRPSARQPCATYAWDRHNHETAPLQIF